MKAHNCLDKNQQTTSDPRINPFVQSCKAMNIDSAICVYRLGLFTERNISEQSIDWQRQSTDHQDGRCDRGPQQGLQNLCFPRPESRHVPRLA